MRSAIWIGALALLLAAVGSPLLGRAAFRRFPPAARAVLSAAAGAALVSFVMTLFALVGVPWSVAGVVAAAAVIAWALALPLSVAAEGPQRSPRGLAVAAAALSAVSVAAALAATRAGASTSVDLFFFWGPKAQRFAAARGIDAAFLAEPFHRFMHPYYPPLVTNLQAFAALTAGRFSWTSAMATFPLLLAALAVALPGAVGSPVAARTLASASSALAVGAVAVAGIGAGIAGNGDMPLVFFEALGMALLVRRDARDPAVELLAGVLLAGAAAAKVEGLVFVVAATALSLAAGRKTPAAFAASAARLVLPTAAALCAWFGFGVSRRLFREYSEYGPFLALHFEHWQRVAASVPRSLARTGKGLPYLVPLVCLLAAGRGVRNARLPLATAAALVVFAFFAYLHLAEDPSLWIEWSAPRVFMPVPVLLALGLYAGHEPEETVSGRTPSR